MKLRLLVCNQSVILDLKFLLEKCSFQNIAVVVAYQFVEVGLRLKVGGDREALTLDDLDHESALLEELLLNSVLVTGEGFSVLSKLLVAFNNGNRSDGSPLLLDVVFKNHFYLLNQFRAELLNIGMGFNSLGYEPYGVVTLPRFGSDSGQNRLLVH